jgi:hypothetical protein
MSVGSPHEVIDKTMSFRTGFGDYQRQLWNLDAAGLPLGTVLDQIELLASEVVPFSAWRWPRAVTPAPLKPQPMLASCAQPMAVSLRVSRSQPPTAVTTSLARPVTGMRPRPIRAERARRGLPQGGSLPPVQVVLLSAGVSNPSSSRLLTDRLSAHVDDA